MKRLLLFLTIATISTVGIVIGASSRTREKIASTPRVVITQPKDTAIVDGATNPQLIPDHVAYSLLFRLIAGRETEDERVRIRDYMRLIGLEGADADALISVAEDFNRRVSLLDNQAATIRDRYVFVDADGNPQRRDATPTQEERAQLRQLQTQKELLVIEVAASLQHRLSPDSLLRMRQHVNEHMKRRIKLSARQNSDSLTTQQHR